MFTYLLIRHYVSLFLAHHLIVSYLLLLLCVVFESVVRTDLRDSPPITTWVGALCLEQRRHRSRNYIRYHNDVVVLFSLFYCRCSTIGVVCRSRLSCSSYQTGSVDADVVFRLVPTGRSVRNPRLKNDAYSQPSIVTS